MKISIKPYRAWINQPSNLQPFHKYHRTNVLVQDESENVSTIYFLTKFIEPERDIISSRVHKSILSKGWK